MIQLVRTKRLYNLPKALSERTRSGVRSTSFGEFIGKEDVLSLKWMDEAKKVYETYRKYPNSIAIQYGIGLDYSNGSSKVKQNEFKAYFWIHMAAQGGHPEAQCLLGSWYCFGTNVSRDVEKAIEWLKKSAAQKNHEALNLLKSIKSRQKT